MSSKKYLKSLLLILVAIFALVGIAFCVWMTTPLYAFQDAAIAAQSHDLKKFRERVDVHGLVESLLNDLLVEPASTTPGLTSTQREIANGAVIAAKELIETDLINGIENGIGGPPQPHIGMFGELPASASGLIPNEIGGLLQATTKELSGSAGRLKEIVYSRMIDYARTHRKSTLGRLLGCRPDERGIEAKQMLNDFGLTPQNFRGISSYSTTTDGTGNEMCKVGLQFFSPKVNHNVSLDVEVAKGSAFSDWQIKRILNLQEFFMQQGEDYNQEMHRLMASSLSGITDEVVKNELHGVTSRITQSESAKQLLNRLKIKL